MREGPSPQGYVVPRVYPEANRAATQAREGCMNFGEAKWIFGNFPVAAGLYHVMQGIDLIYIGSSTNLRNRQTGHRTTPWYIFLERRNVPFTWFFCVPDISQRSKRGLETRLQRIEMTMIREMRPMCNVAGNRWAHYRAKPFVFGPGWSAAVIAEREAAKSNAHDQEMEGWDWSRYSNELA